MVSSTCSSTNYSSTIQVHITYHDIGLTIDIMSIYWCIVIYALHACFVDACCFLCVSGIGDLNNNINPFVMDLTFGVGFTFRVVYVWGYYISGWSIGISRLGLVSRFGLFTFGVIIFRVEETDTLVWKEILENWTKQLCLCNVASNPVKHPLDVEMIITFRETPVHVSGDIYYDSGWRFFDFF